MVHASYSMCTYYMAKLQDICDFIGAPLSPDKIQGPIQIINFLGLTLNFLKQVVQIPLEKIHKAIAQIDCLLSSQHNKKNMRGKVQIKQIQKLTGLLNFICKAVPCRHPFLHWLYNLQAKALPSHVRAPCAKPKPHHKVCLDRGLQKDLLMWKHFLADPDFQMHREVKFIHLISELNQGLQIFVDAASNALLSFGCIFPEQGLWAHGHWLISFFKQQKPSISLLELFAIVIAVDMWAPMLQGKQIRLHSDNEATVFCLNKKSSKNRKCMYLLRHLTLTCMQFQIYVTVQHYQGKRNILADALSRGKIQSFCQLSETTHPMSCNLTLLPASLWPISWKMLRQ